MGKKAKKEKKEKKQKPKAKPKKAKVKLKTVRKKWVRILAPRMFNEQEIGRTYVPDVSAAIGRKFVVNLMNLAKDPKKQNISITFEIDGKRELDLTTKVVGFQMSQSSIKRRVRRGKSKIDDSHLYATKDKKHIRVKPFFLTRSHSPKSVQTKMRLEARKLLADRLAKSTYENFLSDLVQHKVQRDLFGSLCKIFPLSACEIRMCSVELKSIAGARTAEAAEARPVVEEAKEESPIEAEA